MKSAGGQAGRFTKAAAAFNGLNGANPIGTSLEPQEEDSSSCDSMVHLIALASSWELGLTDDTGVGTCRQAL